MKIYHVTRKPDFRLGEVGDQVLKGVVVIAEGPSEARALCRDLAAGTYESDPDGWLASANTKCEQVGYPHRWKNSAQVICAEHGWVK
jgi:hypothetical protein